MTTPATPGRDATSRTPTSARVRRALPLVLLLVAVVVAAALSGPEPGDEPLDPTSPGPLGTKALVDSLEELGVPVEVAATLPEDVAVALLLEDHLSEVETDRTRAWVEGGGVLVVADPLSSFTPTPIGTAAVAGFGEAPVTPSCELPALESVRQVLPATDSGLYAAPEAGANERSERRDGAAPESTVACFPRGEGHWLVAEAVGDGAIVALGGPDVFVNARLGEPGHPELMAALLGSGPVVYLRPRLQDTGAADTLVDLVGTNVWMFALQLALAFLLYAAWRARRLGPPVEEPQPVSIPASELVAAVGNLLQETQARRRAAEILREDLRRTFSQRLGVPREAPVEDLVAAVTARTGDDPDEVARILDGPPPSDEDALVALSQAAERLRARALTPMTTRRST